MPITINTAANPIVIDDATESAAGLMSAADKIKLDGIHANGLPWVDVITFPGADLGAQLINADIFLGSKAGVLYVRDGNYTWSTHLNDSLGLQLQPNRVVWFGGGVITCIGADPLHNPYPGPMMALQDNTIIQGTGNSTIFDEPDSSVIFATVTGAGVHLRDFTIQNIANTGPLTLGTSLPNIGFNNGSNCSVVNVLFKNTRSLAVSAGADSSLGAHANGIDVSYCTFDGTKTITLACVNGKAINFHHNHWLNVGASGPNAPYAAIACIDLEPNTLTDAMENFSISDNIFNLTNNKGGAAILVQGAGVGKDGVIADNTIEAGTDSGLGPTSGITVNGQQNVQVVGNNVVGQFSQIAVDINGGSWNTIQANRIRSSGGQESGSRTMSIRGSASHTKVFGNVIIVTNDDAGWAAIVEDATCDNTEVFGNVLFGGTVSPAPAIILAGTDSRQYMNVLNGAMEEGAVAGTAAYSTVPLAAAFPPANAASDSTTGSKFYLSTRTARIAGVIFFWNDATALIIRVCLYDKAGNVLATTTVDVSGIGTYTALFAAPVVAEAFTAYWATMHEITGTRAQRGVDATVSPAVPFFAGRGLVYMESGWAAGDNVPDNDVTGAQRYPVWPIYYTTGASP